MTDALSDRGRSAEATDQPEAIPEVITVGTGESEEPNEAAEPESAPEESPSGARPGWASPADLLAWMTRSGSGKQAAPADDSGRADSGRADSGPADSAPEDGGDPQVGASSQSTPQESTPQAHAPQVTAAREEPVGEAEPDAEAPEPADEWIHPTDAIPLPVSGLPAPAPPAAAEPVPAPPPLPPSAPPQVPTAPPVSAADEAVPDDPPPPTEAIALPSEVFAPPASPRPVPLPPVDPQALAEAEAAARAELPASAPTAPVADDLGGSDLGAGVVAGDAGAGAALPPTGPAWSSAPAGTLLPGAPSGPPPVAAARGRGGRRALLVTAAVLVLGVGGGAVAAAATRDVLPRGTTIGGVELGGLHRDRAIAELSARAPSADLPIPVVVGGRQASLDPTAAGLRLDAAASVDAVLGGAIDPSRVWHQIVGGADEPALPAADRTALRTALEAIARQSTQAPVDGDVTFETAGPHAVAAVTGTSLDVDAALDAVARGWLAHAGTLTLPVKQTQPAITQAEVDRALAEDATKAASGPLAVVIGGTTATVTQAALQPTLSMAPSATSKGRLELVIDGAALRTAVLAAGGVLEQKPQDAKIVLKDGVPTVVPSKDGVSLDPAALAAAAKTALLAPDRKLTLATAVAKPKLTTEQAQALGVKEKVSTFSTNLTSNVPRTNNLRIAARTVNGTLVMPGQVFSLNEVLGKRTPEKGYSEAPTIMGGRLVPGYGGGVSQMATTIYNNVFFAGLEDVYHMPHSFYISRYPEGREATVNFPTVDLKWRNDSPYGVLVEASVTTTVNVSFWSTKQYDQVIASKSERSNPRTPKTVYDPGPKCVVQEANPGFDVSVRRKVIKGGTVVKDQTWRTTYIAEDKVICGPKPDAANGAQGTPGR
ncbi:MAG: VanW family protein [Kineosporiaceae bacterium]